MTARSSQTSGRHWVLAAAVSIGALALVSLACVVIAMNMLHTPRPIAGGVVTTGHVVGQVPTVSTDGDGIRVYVPVPIIDFADLLEHTHRFHGDLDGYEGDTGDAVAVRYDPEKPSRAQLVLRPARWPAMVIFGIGATLAAVAIGIVGVGIGHGVVSRLRRDRPSADTWRA